MNNIYTTLELSGTPLTGYRHAVPTALAVNSTHNELIAEMRRAVLDLANLHNMWQIPTIINQARLHIHVPYNENTRTIYICACNIEN